MVPLDIDLTYYLSSFLYHQALLKICEVLICGEARRKPEKQEGQPKLPLCNSK
jgi:hypothetical protein